MHLMSVAGEGLSQFRGNDTAPTVGGIAYNSDLHPVFTIAGKISKHVLTRKEL
jgi:hypothetical protein